LKELAPLQELRNLSLTGSKVTDVGLKELTVLKRLRKLSLEGTAVTGLGLKELTSLRELRELDLRGTEVKDAEVAEFKKSLSKCRVAIGPSTRFFDR
jgi:hypothetical protein